MWSSSAFFVDARSLPLGARSILALLPPIYWGGAGACSMLRRSRRRRNAAEDEAESRCLPAAGPDMR